MRKRIAIGLLAAAAVVGIVVAQRHELLRFAIQVVPRVAGYSVSAAAVSIGGGTAVLQAVAVDRGSTPILRARRIAIRYSLRALLPGSRHRFGLLGIEVSDATVTLTRYRDGSYNVSIPAGAPLAVTPPRVNPVPMAFAVRVRGLRLELREPAAYDESARSIRIGGMDVDGKIDTAGVTKYHASGAFETRRRSDSFTVDGRVDAIRGYADHRARARVFPLRALANYFADTAAVRILRGAARNFDAEIYALDVVPNVAPEYHVSLSLDMEGGRIALQPLAAPIDSVRARLHVVDDVFYVRHATAMLAGIPLSIEGGVYDLGGGLTGRQQLRVGVSGTGDMRALRQAFDFMRDQPVSGATQLGVLVAGPVDDPVIVARATAAHARYRALPFDALSASVIYHAGVVALAPLHVSYAGVDVMVRGTLITGTPLRSDFALHVTGSARRLPYLDEMLGDEPIEVDAAATGSDLLFHVAGSAASARGVGRLAALVSMDPNGTARIEPFWFHTERGDLDGGYILDRPRQTSAFWLQADNLRMRPPPPYPVFPGLELPQMPPMSSRRVAASLAGGGAGAKIFLAGKVTGDDATIAGVKFDRLEAGFGGTLSQAAINSLHATGPWGTFGGRGSFSPQRFVALGNYAGTFEGLQPFLGSAIAAHGGIAGPVGIAVAGDRIIVQGSNLAMHHATLRGVPIEGASLTLAVEKDRLQIYSANARAAGGRIVAAGSYSLAPPNRAAGGPAVALIANRLHAAQLRGIGLPLTTGSLYATGNLAAGSPHADLRRRRGRRVGPHCELRARRRGRSASRRRCRCFTPHARFGRWNLRARRRNDRFADVGFAHLRARRRSPGGASRQNAARLRLPQLYDRRIVQRALARRRPQPRADDRRSRRGAGRRRQRVAVRRCQRADRRRQPRSQHPPRFGRRRNHRGALHGGGAAGRNRDRRQRAARGSLRFQQLLRYGRHARRQRQRENRGRRKGVARYLERQHRRARIPLSQLADRRYTGDVVEREKRHRRRFGRRRCARDAAGTRIDRAHSQPRLANHADEHAVQSRSKRREFRSLAVDAGAGNAKRADHRAGVGKHDGSRALSEIWICVPTRA